MSEKQSSAEHFFATSPALPSSIDVQERLVRFLGENVNAGGSLLRPLAIVTSGGTTVPLEQRCVRFIDNFSAGTRGAVSTEKFVEGGYAVILMYRKGSIEPWTSKLPSSILSLVTACMTDNHEHGVVVNPSSRNELHHCLDSASKATTSHSLLPLPFETIFEYLQLLRMVSTAVAPLGRQVLFYLAAAVSDFYVPWNELTEHKIQSADGDLTLSLKKVPKVLGLLVQSWAPQAVVVSFKLETDTHILVNKACTAIKNYGVHAVVANLLHNRKDVVQLVLPEKTFQVVQQYEESQGNSNSRAIDGCSHTQDDTSTAKEPQDTQACTPCENSSHATQKRSVARSTLRLHDLPCTHVDVHGSPISGNTAAHSSTANEGTQDSGAAVLMIARPQAHDVIETLLVGYVSHVHQALIQASS